jgi:hypothetical protein
MWMAEGRCRHDWDQTSLVACLLFNAHRDPDKTRAKTPQDFHPYPSRATKPRRIMADITVLKRFVN